MADAECVDMDTVCVLYKARISIIPNNVFP